MTCFSVENFQNQSPHDPLVQNTLGHPVLPAEKKWLLQPVLGQPVLEQPVIFFCLAVFGPTAQMGSIRPGQQGFVVWEGSAQPARMRAAACLGSKEGQTGSDLPTCYY